MSTLKANTFTGTTSAGSIVVTGEGGSTTTNLQQGLCKCWIQFAGSSLSGTGTTGVDDSFNLTSITDDDTGRYTVNINNDMNNNDYAVHSTIAQSTSAIGDFITNIASLATGSVQVGAATRGGSYADSAIHSVTIHGDLA
tara:strand:+ start:724 stop:1143 length:420 start_codon:yes stop_codon:yes gene_type:complete